MSTECEVAGGVQRLNATTLIFIYHCLGMGHGYRIGISTAATPLGPWTKPPATPNLDVGTASEWDKDSVASFNIMPDPEKPGTWLGFFEGGMGPGSSGWTLGLARASHPLGPWHKHPGNPILLGSATVDTKRCFHTNPNCDGLYVGSVQYGAHTNFSYWLYMEAPINPNDEGPLALWTSDKPEGPFTHKAYVLDGGLTRGKWDSGRYSESRVHFDEGGGLFHVFATGSAVGEPAPNKVVEQIGWAWSTDGLTFVEHAHNPVAPANESTPLTSARSLRRLLWPHSSQPLFRSSNAPRSRSE